MPTPDDAMLSPVEHESNATHATCPPEESRTITEQDSNPSSDSEAHTRSSLESVVDVPMQQPTPPPQDSPSYAQSPTDSHTKPSSSNIEAPNRDIPTPVTTIDDGTDDQRTSHASPLSVTAPGPVAPPPPPAQVSYLASPFPANRVSKRKITSWA